MSDIGVYIQEICDISPNQMSFNEREFIYNTIKQSGSENLLVFGAGNDSKLWGMSSINTVVLENDDIWLNKISTKYKDILELKFMKVSYNMFKSRQECLDAIECDDVSMLKVNVSDDIFDIKWDAIIVDSPTGYRESNEYYRASSIRLASQLAESGCHIFVHDYDRHIETVAVSKFLDNKQMRMIDRTGYILK